MNDPEDRISALLHASVPNPPRLNAAAITAHTRAATPSRRWLAPAGIAFAVLLVALVPIFLVSQARHGHSSPGSPAATGAAGSLCHSALGGAVLSEIATTVGEARATRYGPPTYRPVPPNAFPGAASTDKAAWCWVATMQNGRVEAGSYTCYLVGPDSSKIQIVIMDRNTVPTRPPGAYIR
jgi:hypothetical protein